MANQLIVYWDHNGNVIPNIDFIIAALQHHTIDGKRLLQLKTPTDYTKHSILVYGDASRLIEFLNGFIGTTTEEPLTSVVAPNTFIGGDKQIEILQNEVIQEGIIQEVIQEGIIQEETTE